MTTGRTNIDWIVGLMDDVAAKPNRPGRYNQAKAVEGDPTNGTITLAVAHGP